MLALTLLAISASLALAGDIVAMPTGNMMPAKTLSLGYIYWNNQAMNIPGIGKVRDFTNVGEFFYGVTNRLEIDYLWLQPQGWGKLPGADSSVSEANIYYAVATEKYGTHPSLIVGATNVTGNKWLPSASRGAPPAFDDRISPFVLSSYNIKQPAGPPSWEHPLVRVHLRWGANWHGNRFFGGAQVLFNPKYGAAALNYQDQPAYLAAWMPLKGVEINAGWDQGDPLLHAAYSMKF